MSFHKNHLILNYAEEETIIHGHCYGAEKNLPAQNLLCRQMWIEIYHPACGSLPNYVIFFAECVDWNRRGGPTWPPENVTFHPVRGCTEWKKHFFE